MEKILTNLVQMSIYGSIAIVAVLILRKCFAKFPKKITCLFWIVPIVRLLCPLNIGMTFSLMNITGLGRNMAGDTDVSQVGPVVDAALARPLSLDAHQMTSVSDTVEKAAAFNLRTVMFCIWALGVVTMLTYLTVKAIKLHVGLKTARKVKGKAYYVSDVIETSFVLGIIRPTVYMQAGLSEKEEAYIYMHELTHIKNKDHISRLIGVLTVCLHWFNPLVWLGFIRMCSDLEMRCDEDVIDAMGSHIKKAYCMSMVEHAMERSSINRGLYAAFAGDNHNGREIKMRVNNLIKYKNVPKILAAVVIVFAICTVTVLSSKAAELKEEKDTPTVEIQVTEDGVVSTYAESESEEEHVGKPVGDPNLTLDLTEEEALVNYGFNGMEIPDDVEYSDEGRPYSKSYDYRTNPTLKKLAEVFEKNGYTVKSYDVDYLDKEGNIKTGKELYHFTAEIGEYDVVNVNLCSKEYGDGSFNEYTEEDGVKYTEITDGSDGWHIFRIYDSKAGFIMDAEGEGVFDWKSMGLIEAARSN